MRSGKRPVSLAKLLSDLIIFSAVPLLALLINGTIFSADEDEKKVNDDANSHQVTHIKDHQREQNKLKNL